MNFVTVSFFIFLAIIDVINCQNYEQTITFTVQNQSNSQVVITLQENDMRKYGCDPSGKFSIVVHGWLESCQTPWVLDLLSNLTSYRGGCVMCMDYNNYSRSGDYFGLVNRFQPISNVLLKKLRGLNANGFDYGNGFLFGFSFGSHLVFEAGRNLGNHALDQIDACDPAGPGFDGNITYNNLDPKLAAKNVQCIHSSNTYGTTRRVCHQNWNMGFCGWAQNAAGPFPMGSHGLCPYIYANSFENKFYAVKNVFGCPTILPAAYPANFTMGYLDDRKGQVYGELYAMTSAAAPYVDNTYFADFIDNNTI